MAPQSRRPAAIEIMVETLTGAGFRLRVSSFETVLSVKARIQRIEGVPASQQHLIFQERELPDSASLIESGVGSGSRLQLVVAMRGGPVSTRRLPMYDDITHAEMQQLMEMQNDTPWESDSSGRQVTLLVFREGDQVNFYRVMENTDGTFSPLSDSWGSSIRNMFQEENAEEVKRRIEENTNTMSKVMDLKHKMQQMTVRKKGRLAPSLSRPLDPPPRGRQTPRPTATPSRVHFPPVAPASATTSARPSASFPLAHTDLSESFSRLSRSRRGGGAAPREVREAEVPTAAARGASAASEHERPLLASRGTVTSRGQLTSRGQVASGRRRKLSLSESAELFKQMQAQRGLAAARGAAADRGDRVPGAAAGAARDYGVYRRTLTKLARHPSQPEPSEPTSPGSELPVLFETDERRGGGAPPGRRQTVSAGCRRPRTSPLHYSKDDAERAASPALSLRPTDGRARQLCRILSARAAAAAAPATAPATAHGTAASPVRAAPPAAPAAAAAAAPRPKRPRCQLCKRRLGLAAVHGCHCAGVFCTQHRYPEAHQCSYDFKTEGRRILERANPLVMAPKLPKI